MTLDDEFARQVENLVAKGYPRLLGMPAEDFRADVEPLRGRATALEPAEPDLDAGRLPFVLVVGSETVPVETALELVEREGKTAYHRLYPVEPDDFAPIARVLVPEGMAYLLLDVDRGADTRDVTPDEALETLTARGRTPLTIDEGIAVLTHFPGFLQKNNCYYLLASRCGDKRIPALWLSEGRPRLGWCWAGNPHSWLGSASSGGRVAL